MQDKKLSREAALTLIFGAVLPIITDPSKPATVEEAVKEVLKTINLDEDDSKEMCEALDAGIDAIWMHGYNAGGGGSPLGFAEARP